MQSIEARGSREVRDFLFNGSSKSEPRYDWEVQARTAMSLIYDQGTLLQAS